MIQNMFKNNFKRFDPRILCIYNICCNITLVFSSLSTSQNLETISDIMILIKFVVLIVTMFITSTRVVSCQHQSSYDDYDVPLRTAQCDPYTTTYHIR